MLPFAWLLSLTGVLQNVWIAMPIGEAISLLCALYLNTKIKKLMAEKEKSLNN